MSGVLDIVTGAGAHAIWLGLPQTADAGQTRRYRIVTSVVAGEARRQPETVTYVNTFSLLAGPGGGYAQYVEGSQGRLVRIRAADGVHLEREGGDRIARAVVAALRRTYDLTSWKKKKRLVASIGG